MDGQRTIVSKKKKVRKNNIESSIEPPTAELYFCASGWFFHSRSHNIIAMSGKYTGYYIIHVREKCMHGFHIPLYAYS